MEPRHARAAQIVEAGTGVGKSFAYLLPAVERIVNSGARVAEDPHFDQRDDDQSRPRTRRERVVISTHTIARLVPQRSADVQRKPL